jgi:hypothetical protein
MSVEREVVVHTSLRGYLSYVDIGKISSYKVIPVHQFITKLLAIGSYFARTSWSSNFTYNGRRYALFNVISR